MSLTFLQKRNPGMKKIHSRIFSFFGHTAAIIRFQLYDRILPLLYPGHCPVCGVLLPYGSQVCIRCRPKLPYVRGPVCCSCGKPVLSAEQEYCYDCRIFPKSFRGGVSLFIYNEKTRPAMAAFKYHNRRTLSQFFARELCRQYGGDILRWKPDALIPIPVHRNKRRQRGYNQAELLARDLSVLLNIPCPGNLLLRQIDTPPQKQFRPQARLNNLQKAFAVNPAYRCLLPRLSSVVLIDDIYTTGATMESCARILLAAGVGRVYVCSVCIGVSRD